MSEPKPPFDAEPLANQSPFHSQNWSALVIRIPGHRLPSLNALLGVGLRRRLQFKKQAQEDFEFALKQPGCVSVTPTTSSPNSSSTAAATLVRSLKIHLSMSKSLSRKRRSAARMKKKR